MTERYDRRAFLRRATALGLAAPSVSTLGCGLEEIRRDDEETGIAGLAITRPVLLPWTDDAVRIRAPLSELPVAYVSKGLRRIFIGVDSTDTSSSISARASSSICRTASTTWAASISPKGIRSYSIRRGFGFIGIEAGGIGVWIETAFYT